MARNFRMSLGPARDGCGMFERMDPRARSIHVATSGRRSITQTSNRSSGRFSGGGYYWRHRSDVRRASSQAVRYATPTADSGAMYAVRAGRS